MSDATLPAGWVSTTLGDVAEWGSGGTPKSGVSHYYGGDIPWVVSGDLNDKTIHSATSTITSDGLDSSSAKWVPEGSVLVAMYGATIGKLGITGRPLTTNQAVAFASPYQNLIDKRFLFWYLRSQRDALRKTGKGGAQPNISQTILKAWPIPVPPLAEQHRIVEALEDHLSRLDAATRSLNRARAWSSPLRRSMLARLRDRALASGAHLAPLEDVAQTSLGKMLDSKKNEGIETPYLRNINVRWGEFDLASISTVPMPAEQTQKFALAAGDLLVCEGGEPGRCAIWAGSEGVMAYQKALHRVRPTGEATSIWLALMIEESVRNGRTRHMLTGTTIKHLPQEKLRQLQIPVPSTAVQWQLVEEFTALETRTTRLHNATRTSEVRADHLRAALLSRAFTGRLVPQDPADEPAPALLDRIRAEREAQGGKVKRGTRRPRKAADAAPPPAPASTPSPATAVQQELPL
ncbi:restriction endonuclease subunit S [Streptomyces goshikiensis]|uniref:restriction endonuclease subunit S n=1 Tax=Streptomyces goshikiensis TaxID=1942 RepID=UPI0037D757AC